MKNYTAIPEKGTGDIHFKALNDSEARHWIINHLDLSKNYKLFRIKTIEDLRICQTCGQNHDNYDDECELCQEK